MIMSALFRDFDNNFDQGEAPGLKNPGGGVSTKVYELKGALPNIDLINSMQFVGDICLTEALWFSEGDEDEMESRVRAYENSSALKILWTSCLEVLRWPTEMRDRIFDASYVVCSLSYYSYQLLSFFTNKAQILCDPINVDSIVPGQKRPEIFGMSQITIEKNIQPIIDIYSELPSDIRLEKLFIGNCNLWGLNHRDEVSRRLEDDLFSVCDRLESSLPRIDIMGLIPGIWGYLGDTRYDFSCYSMLEAMLAGCWIFTGKHLMYDERPGFRFDSVEEAVILILDALERHPPRSGIINDEARQYVVDNNSYDVFRGQLKDLIGEAAFGL